MVLLQQSFMERVLRYTTDKKFAGKLWLEVKEPYSEDNRYYHTLQHLSNVLNELIAVKAFIDDWDTILFSLFYHDIVYKVIPLSSNEEKSAELAVKRLEQLSFPSERIKKCKTQIIATRDHAPSDENDTNFFTDADLSVLGQSWNIYSTYTDEVRKEYSIYPDPVYKTGRKNVLNHFLKMQSIFKTKHFIDKYEIQARQNIKNELKILNA